MNHDDDSDLPLVEEVAQRPSRNQPDGNAGFETGAGAPSSTSDETDVEHDENGLDLARTLSRSVAGAAKNAPRSKPRKRLPGEARTGRTGRFAGPTMSGAHPDERDPQLLDLSLGRLVADHGWSLDLRVHGVFARWAEIVGDEVAQHCQPISFTDGRLVVRAGSTAWMTQLKYLTPTLVRRLNEELGHGSVTVIEIEGPNLPSWKKGPRGTRDGRGPRDTYG